MDILMPALSPTMEQGTLAKWLVGPGDAVSPGDILAEIETDKATMEVEAADEGIIAEILVPAGTEDVAVNTPIARLGAANPETAARAAQAPAPVEPAAPVDPDVVPEAAAVAPVAVTEAPAAPATPASPAHVTEPVADPAAGERRAASPLARRIASQRGIDLAGIDGTGPRGRIVRRDVEAPPVAAPAPAVAQQAAPVPVPVPVPTLAQMGIAEGSYDLVPLDGMRRTVARRMTESFRDTPHFPLTIDLEIDALLATRETLNARLADTGIRISVNDMVIRAAAIALAREPRANASWTPDGIALHHHADIAMAVAVDGGLITPIIRKAETRGLSDIATAARTLAARARDRDLRPEEFQGGTFSISNLGMFGIRSFTSILNAPQGAILSVGVGEQRPVVRDGALAVATVMSVTLTCDHRVVDGAVGAAWLAVFRGLVEDPLTMLL